MNPGLYYLLSPYWAASESSVGLGTVVIFVIVAVVIAFLLRGKSSGRKEFNTSDAGGDEARETGVEPTRPWPRR